MKQVMGGWNPNKCEQEGFVRENMGLEKSRKCTGDVQYVV